ncbi:MAG: CYTH domain-containing protein, partial [bacterium]|nr:CYTH domain-containing protein [bacterium]
LELETQSLGMTSTFDRFLDTHDLALLSKDQSLRVRQRLENMYSGGEFRLTYKTPLRPHERLFIRNEEKLKLADSNIDSVMGVMGAMTEGITGHRLVPLLTITELAREANLGSKGGRVNVSIDSCSYHLPGDDNGPTAQEYVLELESHGVDEATIERALEWALKETGGRLAVQSKYARGLRLLGKL